MMFRSDSNIMDAATNGALAALPIVLGIIANIVAFVSFIAFFNAVLSWCGGLVGYESLSLEVTQRTRAGNFLREFLLICRDRARASFEPYNRGFTVYPGKSIYAAELGHGCPLGTMRGRRHIDRPQNSGE